MAQTFNDRDIELEASALRLIRLPEVNYIRLRSNYDFFTIVNGFPTVNQLIITAELVGQIVGVPTFTVVSGSTGLVDIEVENGKTTAVLPYYSLTAPTAVIRASLDYLGVTYTAEITLGGELAPPSTVILNPVTLSGSLVFLSWIKNSDADIAGYEVRDQDFGWGRDNNYIFQGSTNSLLTSPGILNEEKIWYVKAYDTSGVYSTDSAQALYTVRPPTDISSITHEYADTSLTTATVTIKWPSVITDFGLREYVVSYTDKNLLLREVAIRSNSVTLDADWVGDRLFTVKTIDNLGNISAGYSQFVTKELPAQVSSMRAEVIDSSVLLYWRLPERTSLPISHVIIKRSPPNITSWDEASMIGTKDGEFTNIHELSGGMYKYWIKTVDTDNNESLEATIITVSVNPPSDYIFNAEFTSTLPGTKINTYLDGVELVAPADIGETWEDHFISRNWNTPQDQISAGFPVFIQPGTPVGTYEETFDTGNGLPVILGSSNVTVTFTNTPIIGTCTTRVFLAASADGITYSALKAGTSNVFSNFRFVKLVIEVTENTPGALVEIDDVYVRVDSKIKTDSATALIDAADENGTIVNFRSEFIDVVSVNITASSSVVRIPVYDLKDTIVTGTYTALSGILTISCEEPHGLYPGQNVRVSTADGSIPIVVLTVLSRISDTEYTVEYPLAADGSGQVFLYAQGFRAYLLNAAGGRESGKISWTIRGS